MIGIVTREGGRQHPTARSSRMGGRVSCYIHAALAALLLCLAPQCASAQPLQRAEQRLLDSLLDWTTAGPIELRVGAGQVLTAPDSGPATLHKFVPLVSFRYHDWFAIDETQIRADLVGNDSALGQAGFHGGPMAKIDFGRKRLNGNDPQRLGAIGTAFELGGYASYSYGPARVRLRVRQDVADGHGGATAEVDFRSGLFRAGNFGLQAQVMVSWADAVYMRAFYGVTPAEALETHLPVFSPHAGFKDVTPSLSGEYRFTDHWAVAGSVQYVALMNDASASPVPRTRGLGGRTNMGLFVVYTF